MIRMVIFSYLFLFYYIEGATALDTTPLFLIDNGVLDTVSTQTNPFALTTIQEFEVITSQAQTLSENIVFFIEDHFSIEDVSFKDSKGTPYVHLHKNYLDKKAKYFPKVENPYKFIRDKFESFDFNTFHLRSTTTKLHLDEHYKFIYIYFDDGKNETRIETLRRHDAIIREVFFAIRQLVKGPVTAIYTGKQNPVVVKGGAKTLTQPLQARRSWNSVECGNATFKFYDGKLLNGFDAVMMPRSCSYESMRQAGHFGYNVVFDSIKSGVVQKSYHLFFTFILQEIGWKLVEIQWSKHNHDELVTQVQSVKQPWDQFYESSSPLVMESNEWYEPKLVINSYQIKIAKHIQLRTPNPATTPFHVDYGTPTTMADWDELSALRDDPKVRTRPLHLLITVPILSATLVSIVFLAILGWGVQMIMALGGNDRFDSPDSKALSLGDMPE